MPLKPSIMVPVPLLQVDWW